MSTTYRVGDVAQVVDFCCFAKDDIVVVMEVGDTSISVKNLTEPANEWMVLFDKDAIKPLGVNITDKSFWTLALERP